MIANAASMPIVDRANVILRVMAALGACGVPRVVMMPENGGIRRALMRSLDREKKLGHTTFPSLKFTNTPIKGNVEDTITSTQAMVQEGVKAIVVLGGDGTHRAVAKHCGAISIAGISTGTNNAFPEQREPTITGLAVGLTVTGRIPLEIALLKNKMLKVEIKGRQRSDIAIVDASVTTERYIGARALWRSDNFRELFVTYADPESIGLSAIAGFLRPIGRQEAFGLHVRLQPPATAKKIVRVPIAPGLIAPVGVRDYRLFSVQETIPLSAESGMIALDGEREIDYGTADKAEVTLVSNAFNTINVSACMQYAAKNKLFCS